MSQWRLIMVICVTYSSLKLGVDLSTMRGLREHGQEGSPILRKNSL